MGNRGLSTTDSGVSFEVFELDASHIVGRWVDGNTLRRRVLPFRLHVSRAMSQPTRVYRVTSKFVANSEPPASGGPEMSICVGKS